ncbi:MAG: aldo/keto reductase [Acidimicrobiia bacterium]|nr:aldo/keto reductase [Acidimicrobiia bacterium]
MRHRRLGDTGYQISEIGFGAWPIGGTWGEVSEADAMGALHAALDAGVDFFDTADVYGDGRSERLIARLRRERPGEPFTVATKAGRRLPSQTVEGYSEANLRSWVKSSLQNLETDCLDLLQLHCPPTALYYEPMVFEALDRLVAEGKVRHYGVSVERIEEALKAIEYPGVKTVQIIFNIFRLRPAGLLFREAGARDVGILARVPLASGLLTGKMARDTHFDEEDHRAFNRHGEAFDRGETFSGIDFETGLELVEELRPLVPQGATMAQFALRWILMFDEVSTVIPGAKSAEQARANAAAADLAPLPPETMAAVADLYERRVKPLVHHYW